MFRKINKHHRQILKFQICFAR